MKSKNWWTTPRRWSAAFSIVALVLAIAPRFMGPARYSPNVALVTLTLIAVIWYTCFTYEGVQDARERDYRLRREIARVLRAAMVTELKALAERLDAMAQADRPDLRKVPRAPFLRSAVDRVEVFGGPWPAAQLSRLYNGLLNLQDLAAEYREAPAGASNERGRVQVSEDIRALAADLKRDAENFIPLLSWVDEGERHDVI